MSAYQFSLSAVPPALTAAIVMLFAIGVVLTRFSRIGVTLFTLSIAIAAWKVAFAFMYLAVNAETAAVWAKVGCAGAAFIAPAVYEFVTSLLVSASRRRVIAALGWIGAAQFAILTLTTDHVVARVQRFWWGFYPTYQTTARVAFLLFVGGFLTAALVEIIRAHPQTQGTDSRRVRLFTIALGVGYIGVVDLLPLFGIALYPFGWVGVLGFTAIAMYIVARHGLVPITPSLAANEIIGTMRDLLLVSDREGRIQFANNAACSFLGYNREDIIGRHLDDLLASADNADDTLTGRWIRDREYVFRTKMGQPIELTLSHSPVTRDGEVTGAVLIGRDLRERKRYEWEARRAVALLQATLDSTADGILVIGQDGRVLTWNQRFADLWRIPAELLDKDEDQGLIGQLVDQLSDPAAFLNSLAALHEHPEVESVHVLELKDGRRLEQYSIGRYLDDAPVRVWSFRDVTARLAAEEAVRDSEARYRLLFEQNAAGVCLATITGRIINCNSTFADMVGFSMEDLKNSELRDLLERSTGLDEIRRALDENPTVRGLEIELRRRDGATISGLANVSLLGRGERALVHMTAVDISDRKRVQRQIEFQAFHDALTQLPNRRLFLERLELSLLSAKRSRGTIAVLFIDLDRFKSINDTLGHSVADALLVEIAHRLRSCVRQTDTVARYGGDEFTILLPDLHQPEDAAQVAEKILERIAEPVNAGPATIDASVSIGIALYPYDGNDLETLLRNADDAMYRAKKAGRNGYQLCTEQIKTRAMERLSMQSRLRKAMDDGELEIVYQPQISLCTGQVTGAEAQVRWNDPGRGLVEASEFILVAEETRLIVQLGEWTLLTACRQIREWHDAGSPPLRIAVNISARQFQQRDLDRLVRRALDETGIDPAQLELEIREATAMRDIEMTIEMLTRLRVLGVTVALHDFTAYSSLGSLQMMPINAVKIDPASLEGGATVTGSSAIVGALMDVSRTLGLRVAAENVEREDQLEFLEKRGCQEAQGSYFSPALDPDGISSLLQEKKPLAKPAALA